MTSLDSNKPLDKVIFAEYDNVQILSYRIINSVVERMSTAKS